MPMCTHDALPALRRRFLGQGGCSGSSKSSSSIDGARIEEGTNETIVMDEGIDGESSSAVIDEAIDNESGGDGSGGGGGGAASSRLAIDKAHEAKRVSCSLRLEMPLREMPADWWCCN